MKTGFQILQDIGSKINNSDIYFLNETFKILREYAKKVKKDNPSATAEEVIAFLNEAINKITFEKKLKVKNGNFMEQSNITKGDLCLHKTLMYIKRYPNIIMDSIDNLDRKKLLEDREQFFYTDDYKLNIKQLLQDLCANYFRDRTESIKQQFIEGKLSVEERNKLREYILTCCQNADNRVYEEIRNGYISRIINISTFLDDYGVLEQYCKDYNRKNTERNLSEILEIEYDGKKGNKPQIKSARSLKNRAAVEKLTIQELTALCSFLTNRVVKEDLDLRKLIYILEENDLLDKIFDDEFEIKDFDNEKIKRELTKFKFLQVQIRKKINYVVSQLNKNLIEGKGDSRIEGTNKVRLETGITDFERNNIQSDYEEFFGEQTFEEDFIKAENQIINSINLYKLKDYATESLIILLITNPNVIRWGYVPEYDEKGDNSIERGERNILIAANFQGFNSTFAIHVNLDSIMSIAKQLTGSRTIPVFQGQEAMEMEGKNRRKYANSMFLKLTKEQRAYVKKLAKTIPPEDRNYKYIQNLNWLIDDREVPSYLLDENGKLKEEEVYLLSGEIFDVAEVLGEIPGKR